MDAKRWLGVVVLAGAALAACGKSSTSSSGAGKYPTTTSAKATTSSTAAGAAAGTSAGGSTVSVVTEGSLGAHLVAPDGHTLYLFEKDQGTTSACTGGCAATWPALVSPTAPTGGTGVDASKLSTATGEKPEQVVYNGHLLYEFAGDKAPGDTNGTNVPSWYAVSPAGASIEGAGS